MTPIEEQNRAAKATGYGPIHLYREGDWVKVLIEHDGQWVEVIREHFDGPFSHIIEPLGIEEALKRAKAEE